MTPEQSNSANYLLKILNAAIRAVPPVKFALGIAGVAAAAALVRGVFWGNTKLAFACVLLMLPLMFLLLVFSAATTLRRELKAPALVLTWAMVLLIVISAACTAGFVFTGYPKAFGVFLVKIHLLPSAETPDLFKPHSPQADAGTAKMGDGRSRRTVLPTVTPVPVPPSPRINSHVVTFQAVDKKTGRAVPYADVECGYVNPQQTKTEPKGYFSCEVLGNSQTVLVDIAAPGYHPIHRSIPISRSVVQLEPN
jgi:hypothetical protein